MRDKPWQTTRSRVSPDSEVKSIMRSNTSRPRTPLKGRPMYSPSKSACTSTHLGCSCFVNVKWMFLFVASSQASSRPSSRCSSRAQSVGSDISELSDTADVFTTVEHDTRTAGGRRTTTVTYKTHQTQYRTANMPATASERAALISRGSKRGTPSKLPTPQKSSGIPRAGASTPRSGRSTPR